MARVVEPTVDGAWADEIVALAQGVGLADRCNSAAVAAGRLELTYPSLDAVQGFLARDDALVVIAHDGPTLDGYLIVVDDRGLGGRLGGCQGRWVGLTGAPPQRVTLARQLLEVAVVEYGWVWGRISHAGLRAALDAGITEGAIAPEDPEVITYKRPGG